MDDIIYQSAKSIAGAIRRKDVSAVEVVEAHLRRIDETTPALNAVVKLCSERALDEARRADAALADGEPTGPLHGVPMTIKDSLDTEGVVTTGGTLGRAGFVPERDSTVVARLRRAGAILLGKTNTPELTLAGETDNLVYGRTNNPTTPRARPAAAAAGPEPSSRREARPSTWAATPAAASASPPTSAASRASSQPPGGCRERATSSRGDWVPSTPTRRTDRWRGSSRTSS